MTHTPRLVRPSLPRVIVAGTVASAAYLLEQGVDRRLTPNRYDDLLLWGGLLSRDPRRQRRLGFAVHYTLGITLAAIYAALLPSLPRLSGWRRGVLFAQTENLVLYPGVFVLNSIHPDVRAGRLPSLRTWRYFWVEAARHAAYGAMLGMLNPDADGRDQ